MSEEAFRRWFPDATYAGDIREGWDGCWEARDQEVAELRAVLHAVLQHDDVQIATLRAVLQAVLDYDDWATAEFAKVSGLTPPILLRRLERESTTRLGALRERIRATLGEEEP